MYQRLLERRIADRLWSAFGSPWLLAAGAVLMATACATPPPPSLARASLSAMPADADVAVAVHVAELREPLAEVVLAADLPLSNRLKLLLPRLVVVVAGFYGGAEPGYLLWMRGRNLDFVMGAGLLLEPDWFYVERPYPHYRSVDPRYDDVAMWLLGGDSLVMTNLPLDRVQRAFDAEEFVLPGDVTIARQPLDLLLVIPDLTGAIGGLAADSSLGTLTESFPVEFTWVAGTRVRDGLQFSGALRTPHAGLARVLAAAAGGNPALAGVEMEADGTWVRLDGLMTFERIVDVALTVLDSQGGDREAGAEADQ